MTPKHTHAAPKWAVRSWTIIANALIALPIILNELIPVLTQYRAVVHLSEHDWQRILLGVAVLNILMRRRTQTPVRFRKSRTRPVAQWEWDAPPERPWTFAQREPTPPPPEGWDGDPDQTPHDG